MDSKQYVVTGIPRSGSTFIWQVLDDLVRNHRPECGLLRSHDFVELKHDHIIFVCYRDFRDIVISLSKIWYLPISSVLRHDGFQTFVDALLKQKEKYWDHPNCHFIKYEDYFPDKLPKLVRHIYTSAEVVPVTHHCSPTFVAQKFSLEKAKAISEEYKTFKNIHPKSMIHGNHITSDGNIGNWKKLTSAKEEAQLETLRPLLEKFGYED